MITDMTAPRPYQSPLRERQVRETREQILDALTDLLEDRWADEITTRELASAAGVSQRTVYRHFPDRGALLAGLAERLESLTDSAVRSRDVESIDDLQAMTVRFMAANDEHFVLARAEALLNADPRRFTAATRQHSKLVRDVAARARPELDEADQIHLAALIRSLMSAQSWLRMREEFSLRGTESGPLVAWAIGALFNEIERGNPPPATG